MEKIINKDYVTLLQHYIQNFTKCADIRDVCVYTTQIYPGIFEVEFHLLTHIKGYTGLMGTARSTKSVKKAKQKIAKRVYELLQKEQQYNKCPYGIENCQGTSIEEHLHLILEKINKL